MTSAATADLTALANDLRQAGRDAPKETDKVLAEAANQIMATMLILVPRDTGNLARSITIQASPGRYVIGPNGVEYASYVEFGTGARGEFPTGPYEIKPKAGGTLRFIYGGQTVYARSVTHPGIRPKPYVRPALQAYLDSLASRVADVGVEMIVGKR